MISLFESNAALGGNQPLKKTTEAIPCRLDLIVVRWLFIFSIMFHITKELLIKLDASLTVSSAFNILPVSDANHSLNEVNPCGGMVTL
jgi:hypothetical protein